MSGYTKKQPQADVRTAVLRFVTFDWSRLDRLGQMLVRWQGCAACCA